MQPVTVLHRSRGLVRNHWDCRQMYVAAPSGLPTGFTQALPITGASRSLVLLADHVQVGHMVSSCTSWSSTRKPKKHTDQGITYMHAGIPFSWALLTSSLLAKGPAPKAAPTAAAESAQLQEAQLLVVEGKAARPQGLRGLLDASFASISYKANCGKVSGLCIDCHLQRTAAACFYIADVPGSCATWLGSLCRVTSQEMVSAL